ncbi:MAG: 2-C-methyl-D-erythritol 4-phosphate cytidylyltransferase [Desulfobacula sp.]|uniref:2-C-methyl-D-erythritol 4-phosphate cytidylyltransferase n=1 Tax=Desulfobacula sp. TaxID=2593537 RepID=UPI0025BEB5FB|nr:2-C-methyl-D-erythritol 4-phosphate cytidylyltransferase [Desulfobacula sp.]MCD4722789.1 2-C-methyl-D-erythritol 4-phosphate cytidylyltransferase [Desulfobacula sp.]
MDELRHFAIIVAAGKGLRMDQKMKKQYLHLDGIPILTRTIMAFDKCDPVHEIILVVPKQEKMYCKTHIIDPYGFKKKIHLVEGGKKRQDSVLKGLNYIRDKMSRDKEAIIMIHDGVRPFVNQNIIKDCIWNAVEYGACIPGVKITDTVKHVSSDYFIQKTLNRENLYNAQTPQTFKLDLILRAFEHAGKILFLGTDDASLVEHLGHKVVIINGSKLNIKITTPEDLVLGKYLLTLKLS